MKFFENVYLFNPNTYNERTTNIRLFNFVKKHSDAFWFVFKSYDFTEDGFEEKFDFFKNSGRRILIDNSAELTSKDLVGFLSKFNSLHGITLVTNGFRDKDDENNKILYQRGCDIIEHQFFLKYGFDYYQPFFTPKVLKFKKFLILNGKPKAYRTLLTSLLFHEGLNEHGYISYFHKDKTGKFYPEKTEDVFELGLNQDLRERVIKGLEIIGEQDLHLDKTKFDYSTSHARDYNGDYYNAVDFVVVMESDIENGVEFITEKTLKAIQLNKKFILFSSVGMLEKTKEYYKELYGVDISHLTDWCDNSYDQIEDPIERILRIKDIIREKI